MSRSAEAEDYERRQAEAAVQRRIESSGVPERHKHAPARTGEAWERKFGELCDALGTGFVGLVIGDRGRGKTQMAADLAIASIRRGRPARYVKAIEFFMEVKESYRKQASEKAVLDRYAQAALLVIDAIEVRGETAWEDNLLNHLVDRRYDEVVDTLLVGNVKADTETLNATLGTSILSRAREGIGITACNWPSYR